MRVKTAHDAIRFVEEHGIVLEAARGPVPSLAQAIVGGPIRGSWWGHPEGNRIFNLSRFVRDSADVLTCRLVLGKITFVHRRLWPALVRLAEQLGKNRLDAIREEHTRGGAHKVVLTTYPRWVPQAVKAAAKKLTVREAAAELGKWVRLHRTHPAG